MDVILELDWETTLVPHGLPPAQESLMGFQHPGIQTPKGAGAWESKRKRSMGPQMS